VLSIKHEALSPSGTCPVHCHIVVGFACYLSYEVSIYVNIMGLMGADRFKTWVYHDLIGGYGLLGALVRG
jgi:hypothetical protein